MSWYSGIISFFGDVLDSVSAGASDVAAFGNTMETASKVVFGAGSPIGNAVAAINTDIQQAAAALKVPANPSLGAIQGALVTTEGILVNVWDTVTEAAKAEFAALGLPAGATLGQKIDAVVAAVAPIAINLGLSVIPGGGVLSLATPTITKMVLLALSDIGL